MVTISGSQPEPAAGPATAAAAARPAAASGPDWVPWLIALVVFAGVHDHLGVPLPAARPRLLGPGHLHRVRQAAGAPARAGSEHPRHRVQPVRRPLPADRRADRPAVPDLSQRGHPAGGAGLPDRGIGDPGEPGGRGPAGHRGGADDRRRLRSVLGPGADDRFRLPRDRVRRPAAGLLAVRAAARPDPGRRAVGAAAGLRQGGSGLHRRRAGPGGDAEQRQPPRRAGHRPRPGVLGRAAADLLGLLLVRAGHHRDHPALQRRPRLPVLDRWRRGQPGRARRAGRGTQPAWRVLAGQAAHHTAHPAAGRVPGPGLPARPHRAAQPGAALRVDQQHVLGRRVPLQRDRDADRVPGRGGCAVPDPGERCQTLGGPGHPLGRARGDAGAWPWPSCPASRSVGCGSRRRTRSACTSRRRTPRWRGCPLAPRWRPR